MFIIYIKIIISNVNHSIVMDKLKEILSKFSCPITEASSDSNKYLINDYEETKLLRIFLEKVVKTFKYHLYIVCFDFMDVFYRDCTVN